MHWGRGCPMQPQKHGCSFRTSSTLQHHSHGGCPGDCDLQLHRLAQIDSWLGQFGVLVRDTTTTMPGPCSEKSASPREGRGHGRRRGHKRRRRSAGEHIPWVGVRSLYCFPLAWQVIRVSSYMRRPFPSKETRRISRERDDPGPPVAPVGG